jgi:murein DD-endopeptidase MepM/ murein hydrolase activator NlpD
MRYVFLGAALAATIVVAPLLAPNKTPASDVSVPTKSSGTKTIQYFSIPTSYAISPEDIINYVKQGGVKFGKENPMYQAAPEELKGLLVVGPINPGSSSAASTAAFIQKMALPVDPKYFNITSNYGMRQDPVDKKNKMHWGLDISSEGIEGQPVYAVEDGVVEFAGENGDYGNTVFIAHEDGQVETVYAHLKDIDPALFPTEHVKKGQIIGHVGSTGRSTGPHLHFELRLPVDPTQYLQKGEENATENNTASNQTPSIGYSSGK